MKKYFLLTILGVTVFIISTCQSFLSTEKLVPSNTSIEPTKRMEVSPTTSITSSTPPPPLATLTPRQKCEWPFLFLNSSDMRIYLRSRNISEKAYVRILSSQIIDDSESFLNNCTTLTSPLTSQQEKLNVFLHSIASVEESDPLNIFQRSGFAKIEFLDWNDDGTDELILHTRIVYPISFVFYQDNQTKEWSGTMIWPPMSTGSSFNHPSVYLLDFRDAQGRSFVAVEGEFTGGDNGRNILTIWRWRNDTPEMILKIALTDWYGQPNKWEIKGNQIFIPAAKATERNEAREAITLVLEKGEFVVKNPEALGYHFDTSHCFLSDWNWLATLEICN
jgi:hypothetical protein